jgi:uncharacterized membrane protein
LSRLEALGDAVLAFALTLLALDLLLPQISTDQLAQGIWAMFPKLLILVFAFLLIGQQLDVHQRTMLHIARSDGIFVWLYFLALMFVALMPVSVDILGRFPIQPLALVVFGTNSGLVCSASLSMWLGIARQQIAGWGHEAVSLTLITLPLVYVNIYIVYVVWVLMPVISYTYGTWMRRRFQNEA